MTTNTIHELDLEILQLKASLHDIDQNRAKVQNILDTRLNDKQQRLQRARQDDANAAAAKRAEEEAAAAKRAADEKAAAEKAAAEKAALDAKTKPTTGNKGDTAQPKA